MTKNCTNSEKFYGTATIGEKGQLVIPSEAREKMNLKKGEKLLVFGIDEGIVALAKLSNVENFVSHLAKKSESLRSVIKNLKD